MRLTLAFTLLVLVVGSAIVGSVFFAMTYLTNYDIASDPSIDDAVPTDFQFSSVDGEAGTAQGFALATVTDKNDILPVLVTTSAIVFGVVLLAGVALSWIIAGRVLRPVEKVTSAARAASTGSLDLRIALDGPPDEFKRLADTFDDMMERLGRAFQAQRRFSANASHELRTPLATTQAILDVALLDPEAIKLEPLVRKLRETNTRNIETVESLLSLSDAQSGSMENEPIDLHGLAREVMASAGPAAADHGIDLHSTILSCTVMGDPTLVRLLLSNLIGNAIRYNVTDGDVWLTVADGLVRIENTGPIVEADELPRLVEPFFRSAGRVAGSHGLGLALVDAIATGHGADLAISAREGGGLVVEAGFPR